jgi:hypothetical protein
MSLSRANSWVRAIRVIRSLFRREIVCPQSKGRIPQFSELSKAQEERLLSMLRGPQVFLAMEELQRLTWCTDMELKSWITHRGKPTKVGVCPYCGKELRTPSAKQCRHCFRAWHSAETSP